MRIHLSDTQNRTVLYVLFPLAFYYVFLTSIYVLMKTTVLSEDLLFIRFYVLTGVFLVFSCGGEALTSKLPCSWSWEYQGRYLS